MFDSLTTLRERNRRRIALAVAAALLVHLLLIALLVYAPQGQHGRAGATGGGVAEREVGEVAPVPPLPAAAGSEGAGAPAPEGRGRSALGAPGGATTGEPAPADTGELAASLPPVDLTEAQLAALAPLALSPDSATGTRTARLDLELPDTMELGRRYPASLTIVLPIQPREAAGPADSVGLRLTAVREATVAGAGFVVQPRTPTLQVGDSTGVSRWAWVVTPRERGERALALALDVVVMADGRERVGRLYSHQQEIVVRESPLQRVSRFFATHWTWLWLLAALPTLAWWRARYPAAPLPSGPDDPPDR